MESSLKRACWTPLVFYPKNIFPKLHKCCLWLPFSLSPLTVTVVWLTNQALTCAHNETFRSYACTGAAYNVWASCGSSLCQGLSYRVLSCTIVVASLLKKKILVWWICFHARWKRKARTYVLWLNDCDMTVIGLWKFPHCKWAAMQTCVCIITELRLSALRWKWFLSICIAAQQPCLINSSTRFGSVISLATWKSTLEQL